MNATQPHKHSLTSTTGGKITALRQHNGNKFSVYQGEDWHKGLKTLATFDNHPEAVHFFYRVTT